MDRRSASKPGRARDHKVSVSPGGNQLVVEPEVDTDQAGKRDVREVAVLVCTGCWDGVLPWPPYQKSGRVRDVGIDLWFESRPVVRQHRCPGTKYEELPDTRQAAEVLKASFPLGNWKTEVLVLPGLMYDQLIKWGGVKPGAPITDPRVRMSASARKRRS